MAPSYGAGSTDVGGSPQETGQGYLDPCGTIGVNSPAPGVRSSGSGTGLAPGFISPLRPTVQGSNRLRRKPSSQDLRIDTGFPFMSDRMLPNPDRPDDGAVPAPVPWQERTPGGYQASWEEPEDESFDWRRYLAAVLRNKWLIVLGTLVGLGAGFLAYQSTEPTYSVESTVWIESANDRSAGDAAPIRPSQLLSSSGWVDLMRSFAVLDPVVEELRLYVRPHDRTHRELFAAFTVREDLRPGVYELRVSQDGREVTLWTSEGVELERTSPGSPVGASLGFDWTPLAGELRPGSQIAFSVSRPRDMSRTLSRELDVRIDREGTFLRVGHSGSDPQLITDIVNSVVDRYAEVAEQLKRARLDELTRILEEQLEYAEVNLREAELALERFRVATISLPSEQGAPVAAGLQQTQNPVRQNFFNLKVEQEEVRRDREAIARAMARSAEEGRLATEALEVIPSVRASSDLMRALSLATERRADLRTLRLRYTDEHPSVQEVLADVRELEQQTVPALLGSLLAAVDERQGEIERFVGQASEELQQIPPRVVEEARLERRYSSAENLFRDLQGRFESARLGAASTIPDVRILDRAQIPGAPSSDERIRYFAMALMAGLGLGLLGAILRDRMDPLVRRPEQVTRDLGLPILGTIPHARSRNGHLHAEDQEQLVEAFRNLRLAVTYADQRGSPLVVTISSPGVGDGKSFTTSNLALAFAELGRSTLVIDGDIRRGTMHSLFACDRRPGLTDYLSGEAGIDEIMRETEHPSLTVIPSGSRFRDAPELLGAPAMQSLMKEARSRFDVILVDSAPLGAAVDAYLLGSLSGALLLVFRNGSTDRELAEARLADLDRLPIRLLGAVLNDVPTGSGPYRYYSYLPGYGAEDEDRPSGRKHAALAETT